MKTNDEIYFKMFCAVRSFMNKNKSIWELNQIITTCMQLLDNNINQLSAARAYMMKSKQNVTSYKATMRSELNLMVFLIKESLRIYYQINAMNEEMLLLTYPISTIRNQSEDTFYVSATHISETSLTLVTELGAIGIKPAMIAQLKTDLLTFNTLAPQKDKNSKMRAACVKLIPLKIKETRLMFRNTLDGIISIYQTDFDEFNRGYKISRRRMLKPGKHKYYTVLICGKLTQTDNSMPLSEVIIIAGKKKKTTITDINGNYEIRVYLKDADSISFSRQGYTTLNMEIPTKHTKNQVVVNASMELQLPNQNMGLGVVSSNS